MLSLIATLLGLQPGRHPPHLMGIPHIRPQQAPRPDCAHDLRWRRAGKRWREEIQLVWLHRASLGRCRKHLHLRRAC